MSDLILAIDQGTTGTTALLLDSAVRVVASCNVEFPNHYPAPGEVEHDVDEIFASVGQAVGGALSQAHVRPDRIAAVGITNQRETSLFWNQDTGRPYHRALVWQDRRTADRCRALKAAGHEALFKQKTGLVLDPYFSGTKAAWMLENVAGLRADAEAGRARFGTIDSWLTWRLCGAHVTDPSNASRTLLMDLDSLDWDPELLEILGVPAACLPRIGDSSEVYGRTKGLGFLPDGIPVAGLIGDQQGALFGQACFTQGMAKCTYGTGAFVLMNTGSQKVYSDNGMLTTVAWRVNGEVKYALEGSAFIAGAAVQWLRDNLGIISKASEIEALAASVPDTGGVVFVPGFAGLGAPHWRPEARGLISGITGGTTKAHIARAVLEGIALEIGDILRAMANDLGGNLKELRVDGGAARNDLLMQLQSDVLDTTCVRPSQLETTALGSAFLAGLAVGLWDSPQGVADAWREDRRFARTMREAERDPMLARWSAAVERA
ncbi:MAG: glycerol kinase GlpK [Alphaproteobacteria bacterium]|nr:glycerol kinase GlpK [Alphaproteobacteria bacterium]